MSFITTGSTGKNMTGTTTGTYAGPCIFANKIRVDTAVTIDTLIVRDSNGGGGSTYTAKVWDANGNILASSDGLTYAANYSNCFKLTTPCTLQPNTDYYIGFIVAANGQYVGYTNPVSTDYTKTIDGVTFTFGTKLYKGSAIVLDVATATASAGPVLMGIDFKVGTVSPRPTTKISTTLTTPYANNNGQPILLSNGNLAVLTATAGQVTVYKPDGTQAGSATSGTQMLMDGFVRASDNHLIVVNAYGQVYDFGVNGYTPTYLFAWAFGTSYSAYMIFQTQTGDVWLFGAGGRTEKRSADLLTSKSNVILSGLTTPIAHAELPNGNILLVGQSGTCNIVDTSVATPQVIYSYSLHAGNYNNFDCRVLSNGNIAVICGQRYLCILNSTLSSLLLDIDTLDLSLNLSTLVEIDSGILVAGGNGIYGIYSLDGVLNYIGSTQALGIGKSIFHATKYADKSVGLFQTGGAYDVISFNTAPNTPVINNPVGTSGSPAVITSTTPALSWTFNDLDSGDTQSAYQVQVENDAGTVIYDTGKVANSNTSIQVPSGTLTVGSTYSWRVCTWDSNDAISNYSALNYFTILTMANVGDTKTFSYTGAAQSYTVPANVTKLKLTLAGGEGDGGGTYNGQNNGPGGLGAKVVGEYASTPGEIISLVIGGKGTGALGGTFKIYSNSPPVQSGLRGGGGTRVIKQATATILGIAGGGGGGGGAYYNQGYTGTAGGTGTGTGGQHGVNGAYPFVESNNGNNGLDGDGGGGGAANYASGGEGGEGGANTTTALLNAIATNGNVSGNGYVIIEVLEVSNPAQIATRTPGSTDQTTPVGANLTPTLSWTFSGNFTQTKFQVKIYQGTTLIHDSGLVTSAATSYSVPAAVLRPGIVYGWELQVTDSTNTVTPTDRVYFITNNMPGVPTNLVPLDASRQTLKPTLGFTMGDDVENDSQHFILKLATDSGFTQNLQTFDTRNSVTGWTYDDNQVFPAAGLDYTKEGHTVSYTLQNNLVEGTLYYWKVAPVDGTTNGIGTYSDPKTLKVGTRLEVTLKEPLQTTVNAKRILVKVLCNIAADGTKPAELKIFSCNNGLDANPTWEDITGNILDETYHVFTNTIKTADNWAVNIKIIVEANDSTDPIEILGFGFSFD